MSLDETLRMFYQWCRRLALWAPNQVKNYKSWDERRGEGKDSQMDTQEGDSSSDSSPALSAVNDTPPPESLLGTRPHSGGHTVNHQAKI